jgi:hypothetical protein
VKWFLIIILLAFCANIFGQDSTLVYTLNGNGIKWDTLKTIQNNDLIICSSYGLYYGHGSFKYRDEDSIRVEINISFLAKKDIRFKLISVKLDNIEVETPKIIELKKNTHMEMFGGMHTLNLGNKHKRGFDDIYPISLIYKYQIGKKTKTVKVEKIKIYATDGIPIWLWQSNYFKQKQ